MDSIAYVDQAGRYLGSFDITNAPEGGTAVSVNPTNGLDTWNGSAWIAPPATPAQVLAAKLAAGIILTSTGTPAINGTYAYDQQTQDDLAGLAATIGLLGTFPDGTTSGYQYPQQGGQAVTTFASIAAFKAMYAPYAKLLQQLRAQGAVLAAGGTPQWPPQAVTVA